MIYQMSKATACCKNGQESMAIASIMKDGLNESINYVFSFIFDYIDNQMVHHTTIKYSRAIKFRNPLSGYQSGQNWKSIQNCIVAISSVPASTVRRTKFEI